MTEFGHHHAAVAAMAVSDAASERLEGSFSVRTLSHGDGGVLAQAFHTIDAKPASHEDVSEDEDPMYHFHREVIKWNRADGARHEVVRMASPLNGLEPYRVGTVWCEDITLPGVPL